MASPPRQPAGSATKTGEVIELRSRSGYRPDMGALARQQIASARNRLGLTPAEFAEVLQPVLGWAPSAAMIESWEDSVVPPGDVILSVGLAAQSAPREPADRSDSDLVSQLLGSRFADVEAVYATRSEFTARMPPHTLFGGASDIKAAGLSLNILCQQYADESLRSLIENGANVRCLFLAPDGAAIKAREREEGHEPGHLSSLNHLNIQILVQRVRERLAEPVRDRLAIATYDETIRFNITIVDGAVAVVQPYLYAARGIEAPTLVLHRRDTVSGLFRAFEETFSWLWERSTRV